MKTCRLLLDAFYLELFAGIAIFNSIVILISAARKKSDRIYIRTVLFRYQLKTGPVNLHLFHCERPMGIIAVFKLLTTLIKGGLIFMQLQMEKDKNKTYIFVCTKLFRCSEFKFCSSKLLPTKKWHFHITFFTCADASRVFFLRN